MTPERQALLQAQRMQSQLLEAKQDSLGISVDGVKQIERALAAGTYIARDTTPELITVGKPKKQKGQKMR